MKRPIDLHDNCGHREQIMNNASGIKFKCAKIKGTGLDFSCIQ